MTATLAIGDSRDDMDMKWHPMIVVSICLHLALFSTILFIPESMSARDIKGIVYEVNLVDMPGGKELKPRDPGPAIIERSKTVIKKSAGTRRIQIPQKKPKKPLVIAKRTIKRKSTKTKKPKITSSQQINRAIAKIEKRVQSEEVKSPIDKAISKLESEERSRGGSGTQGGGTVSGISMRIYQMEIETRIKGNWSYPVALQGPKTLEAIVLLKVKNNGTILSSLFKTRSRNAVFDESVSKAIEKSNPLPPFPEGYRKSYEEIEINFNLRDLEG